MTAAEAMDAADAQRRQSRSREWVNAYHLGAQHERERHERICTAELRGEYQRGLLAGYRLRTLTFFAGWVVGAVVSLVF